MFANLTEDLNQNHMFIEIVCLMPYQDDVMRILNFRPEASQAQHLHVAFCFLVVQIQIFVVIYA